MLPFVLGGFIDADPLAAAIVIGAVVVGAVVYVWVRHRKGRRG
jgi:hypothetical protein